MIVLSEEGIERLDKAFKVVQTWQKRKVAIPLFLTELYVESSLDVFPIEYLNFQRNHLLVYGKDILEELSFDRELVRLQCEREIKGKLLLLREAYMETSGKGKALRDVIGQSIQAFLAIFDALLARRTYATTGDVLAYHVRSGGHDLNLGLPGKGVRIVGRGTPCTRTEWMGARLPPPRT